MSCYCTDKISPLIDGELSQVEAREVERHLINCVECQQVRSDFLNLRSQIGGFESSWQPAAPRPALAKLLSSRLNENSRSGLVSPAPRGQIKWRFSPAVAAFATLVVVGALIGLLLYPKSTRQNSTAENMVAANPSPVPSASLDKKDESKATETKQKPEVVQPSGNKDGNESKSPSPAPSNPVRKRPAPTHVREPKPGEQFAKIPERVRSADAETMTAMHFEKSELLLRAFRNVRLNEPGMATEVGYERKRAQKLVYQNMMLRREADAAGDVQVATLLENLEPILIDIANLPDQPNEDDVRVIKERVERKNIVALLQVNSTALARALD
jgi:Putative zinc-finger